MSWSRWEDYFWPDTPGVLKNKLGIRDQELLTYIEEQISLVRIAEYLHQQRGGDFGFEHYLRTHHTIFRDVYEWSGQPRTVPKTAMTKRGPDIVNFAVGDPAAPVVPYYYRPGPEVRQSAEYVFARLQDEDGLTGLRRRDFVERLGTYWGVIDSIHCFREGNTRTEYAFFHSLAQNAGYDLGAGLLHSRRAAFIAARFHGHATGKYGRLTDLLASTVEVRRSAGLTDRERRWASDMAGRAQANLDLIGRVLRPQQRQGESGLEL